MPMIRSAIPCEEKKLVNLGKLNESRFEDRKICQKANKYLEPCQDKGFYASVHAIVS